MTGDVRRLLASVVLVCVSASMAFAQAGQSAFGDCGGQRRRRDPRGVGCGAQQRDRRIVRGRDQRGRGVLGPGDRGWYLHRDDYTAGLQDGGRPRRARADGHPGEPEGDAGGRLARRNGRSQGRLRTDPDPVYDRELDDRRRADLRAARALAERALFRRDAARRRDHCRTARLDVQRPAQQHHQRHHRRRDHRQPAAIDRRLLLHGDAAHRRGRRVDGDGRDPGGDERAWRGADRVHHALGHQRVQQQHLSLLQAPQPELELLLQQDQRAGEERSDRPPVRGAFGWPDHHSRSVRRPEQGVLLLQLRTPPSAK